METRTILVTGGAGFMGSWLVDELIQRGHTVIAVDSLLGGYKTNLSKDCRFVKMDITQDNKLESVMKDVEIVFHLAAYAAEGQSFFSPIAINEINIGPMNRLLVGSVNHNVERFVFTSSMAVYGEQTPPFSEEMPARPEDPYGAAKAYCETVLQIFSRTYDFEYVTIRPHNVYGPRQNIADPYRNVLGIWTNRILRNKPPLIYGDGEQTRAFSYVGDITPALANAGFLDKCANQTINLGSDEVITINQACRAILEITSSNLTPEHIEERPGEVKHAFSTIEKSVRLLNYSTKHKLRDGLERMVAWAREIGPQHPTYTLPLEITKRAPRVWVDQQI